MNAQTSLLTVERESCPFCEIAARRSDQEVVYAGEGVVAFLCEPPATWGHALVVPRAHKRDIWAVERDEAAALMKVAHRLARAMRDRLGAVVPRYEDDTVLPGCVWGMPPWQPPAGGDAE